MLYVVPDPEFRPILNRAPDPELNHRGQPILNRAPDPKLMPFVPDRAPDPELNQNGRWIQNRAPDLEFKL